MSSLREESVDIELATLNQTPAPHSGPLGRLERIKNMLVEHYTPTDGGPAKLKATPRGAFRALSDETRNPNTGAPSSILWDNPELFAALGSQPVSICNAVPRVFDGNESIAYDDKRVVANRLEQSVFHTSDRVLMAPDYADSGSVRCSVWAEQLTPDLNTVNLFVGFKSRGDDAWLTPPRILYAPTDDDPTLTLARVVADADEEHFWVIHNCLVSGNNLFRVHLYDLHGQELDTDESQPKIWTTEPGYWDIVQRVGGGVILAQPNSEDGSTDGVLITKYTQSAGSIAFSTDADNAVHCKGPVAWATNKVDDNYYMFTIGDGEGPSGKIWGYRFDEPMPSAHTHEYNYGLNVEGGDNLPDSLIGYTKANTDPDNVDDNPDLIVSYTALRSDPETTGPAFDPALRFSRVHSCDFEDTVTFIRQNNSTCQVSRAFEHDGEYYAVTYYQSGSGLGITQSTINVDWTAGDYMTGDVDQKIPVAAGDGTHGNQFAIPGFDVLVIPAVAPVNIDGSGTADKVEQITASGLLNVADGTQVLKWTFKNGAFLIGAGGILKLSAGASIGPSTNWDILSNSGTSTVQYTPIVSRQGGTITPGNFTTSGTVEVVGTVRYRLAQLMRNIDASASSLFDNGTIAISGASGGNNGSFTILPGRCVLATANFPFGSNQPAIWTLLTTQSTANFTSPFTVTVSGVNPDTWFFASTVFSSLDVGTTLVTEGGKVLVLNADGNPISGVNNEANNGSFEITGTTAGGATTAGDDAGNVVAQFFSTPIPTATVHLPLDRQTYEFKFQSLTLDYTFQDALVFVRGATNAENNGLYQISFIDFANGTFIAKPADGRTGQRNEFFAADGFQVTIFLQNAVKPVFQPKWFITPLFSCQTAQVGRFEDGLAFADWRFESQSNPFFLKNNFPLHVASVVEVDGDIEFALPYRARSFTSGQPLVAPPNQVAAAAVTVFESTVGIKQFTLKSKCGFASVLSNELLIPGPLSSVFTSSGFREQGINIAPEAPFIVDETEEDDDLHITPGTTHQIVVTYEVTDENGNRIYCPPSPALDYVLSGDNNSVVYGGRMPFPIASDTTPIPNHFGLTNHRLIGITISRTSYRGDLPTIQHFKITDDLNVNGLAPVSDVNPSGFSFPDEFTWNYKDQNPDVSILTSEILYTDKGYLPRFPAAAARVSSIWASRPWIVAYDGSLQFGGEFAEGDAPWFFPGFRYTFGNDKAVSCAPLGNYLIVGCENSMWYIPQPNAFPDASGRNGTLPTPVQLDKIKSGCTGIMIPVDGGVAYTSTVGGVWLITSNFQNVYMSRDIQDQLPPSADITAMQIDGNNRLHVASGTQHMFTYDQVVGTWYNWEVPSDANLLSMVDGQVTYQSDSELVRYNPEEFVDFADDISVPILWRIKFAAFSFGGIRRFKHCWAFQILGEYLGPHRLWAEIGYPDDKYESTSVRGPLIPDGNDAYLAEVNPSLEDASTFTLEIYNDFEDVLEPGRSASIECVSAAVGLESDMAQTTRRLT